MDSATSSARRGWTLGLGRAALLAAAVVLAGCNYQTKPDKPMSKYSVKPPDSTLPPYLKTSIKDLTVVGNVGDFPVSSWGMVVGLRGTGDTTTSTLVHEWMIKELQVHKFGLQSAGYANMTPDAVLNDPHVAVVGVVANLPPGARRGDRVDVLVQAMPGNNTTSLANGLLYRADLKINGLSNNPIGAVNTYAKAQGNIFVNPVYAANAVGTGGSETIVPTRTSLRSGTIPGGGLVMTDRPIHLVLRTPSWSTSRMIENRINQRFQKEAVYPDNILAAAQDEGYVHLMVPKSYQGDWQHFVGVATHLFLSADPAFSVQKAKLLAQEAVNPGARLMDISYCWEALGPVAVPFITPLLSHPQEDVQFAAARAAAFLGDSYGVDRLMQMAATSTHAFRINAVQTLGQLPDSELVNARMAELLDSDQTLVRLAAYEMLTRHGSGHILSRPVSSKSNPDNSFMLDIIDSKGPPLVYCTRVGMPRVAIFGRRVSMQTPVVFSAFDSRLTIANLPAQPHVVNMYYRDDSRPNPVQAISPPGLGEIVARLGGAGDDGFHFTYGDVVAILQTMADQKAVAASFVLQDLPDVAKEVQGAPAINEGRPQADATPVKTGPQIGASLPDLRPGTGTKPPAVSERPQ